MSTEDPEDRAGLHDLDTEPSRATEGLGSLGGGHPKAMLGSLVQSAREKQLKTARGILIAIGILTILANAAQLATMRDRFHKELETAANQQFGAGGFDPAKLKEIEDAAVRAGTVEVSIWIGVGVIYIILGALTRRYPVPTTILGLVLYIAGTAITIIAITQMEGADVKGRLLAGMWIKIFIIIALIKAIQSAIAYQREERAARAAGALAAEPLA